MKVFLSWSKSHSHSYALAFRDWLPTVIQSAEPFMSSQDIGLGLRGIEEIEARLSSISFGILFVTNENYQEPWLLYEAGALSRTIDDPEARLIPILIDVDRSQLSGSPLSHFQNAQSVSKSTFLQLCLTINETTATPLSRELLERSFEKWWPDLEAAFSKVQPASKKKEDVSLETINDAISDLGKTMVELRNNERRQSDLLLKKLHYEGRLESQHEGFNALRGFVGTQFDRSATDEKGASLSDILGTALGPDSNTFEKNRKPDESNKNAIFDQRTKKPRKGANE